MEYEKSFAYYVKEELKINLNDIWNWDKNNELGINPYEIYKGGKNKVWLYCLKKDYHNYPKIENPLYKEGYLITCNNFKTGKRCPYCGGSPKTHYRDSFGWYLENCLKLNLNDIWNYEKNENIKPYETALKSSKKVWIYCLKCDYHNYRIDNCKDGYEISCGHFLEGNRCPYCVSKKIHYKDSLAYKYPNIAKMIAIKENNLTFDDCYSIACHSNKKYYFKCDRCKLVSTRKMILDSKVRQNCSCEFCSDGVSVPEKFMTNILNQLSISFIKQLSSKNIEWCDSYRYDFYLKDYNIIIETHGVQHYEENGFGNSLEYEQINDEFKEKISNYNKINKYIIVDCRKSKLNWLKENIMKELSDIFDLSNIDWSLAWEESQNSLCVKSWELWNGGLRSTNDIGDKLNLNNGTVRKYLKIGTELKKCDYNARGDKKVICLTTKEVFDSASLGAKIKNAPKVCECCNGDRNYSGISEFGVKLKWMWLDEYLKQYK